MDYSIAEEIKDELWDLHLKDGRRAVAERLGVRYNTVGHLLKHLVGVILQRQAGVIPYLKEMYRKSPMHLDRKYERFIKHFQNKGISAED